MCINWHEIFDYCEGFLFWKKSRGHVAAGSIAGNVNGNGYMQVGFEGRHHMVARIIWEMHNGPIPEGMEVDHEDRDRENNLIGNLRLLDRSGNALNRDMQSNNKLGIKGVYHDGRKFVAAFQVKGKHIHVGRFDSAEEASIAYQKKYLAVLGGKLN